MKVNEDYKGCKLCYKQLWYWFHSRAWLKKNALFPWNPIKSSSRILRFPLKIAEFPPGYHNFPLFLNVLLYFKFQDFPLNVKISWECGSRVPIFSSHWSVENPHAHKDPNDLKCGTQYCTVVTLILWRSSDTVSAEQVCCCPRVGMQLPQSMWQLLQG